MYMHSATMAEALMVIERDAVEEDLEVAEGGDGHPLLADLAPAHRVVGVVAHEGGHVEGGGEPRRAVRHEVLEALVGVGR
jgi:hypothetical protein